MTVTVAAGPPQRKHLSTISHGKLNIGQQGTKIQQETSLLRTVRSISSTSQNFVQETNTIFIRQVKQNFGKQSSEAIQTLKHPLAFFLSFFFKNLWRKQSVTHHQNTHAQNYPTCSCKQTEVHQCPFLSTVKVQATVWHSKTKPGYLRQCL